MRFRPIPDHIIICLSPSFSFPIHFRTYPIPDFSYHLHLILAPLPSMSCLLLSLPFLVGTNPIFSMSMLLYASQHISSSYDPSATLYSSIPVPVHTIPVCSLPFQLNTSLQCSYPFLNYTSLIHFCSTYTTPLISVSCRYYTFHIHLVSFLLWPILFLFTTYHFELGPYLS